MVTDAQILAAYAEGLSLLDVALALGVGEKRVRRVVRQAGAIRPNTGQNRYTKDHAKAARIMLAEASLSWVGPRITCPASASASPVS